MMEVGFSEILLISVLALIVLGPEKLPKVAAEIGRWVGKARSMARQFREQLEDEAALAPSMHRPVATPQAAAPVSAASDITVAEASPPEAGPAEAIQLDQAELTPHSPIEDYIDTQAAAVPAAAEPVHEDRLPHL